MKARHWITGTGVVVILIGLLCLWASRYYQPLLYVSGNEVLRKSEWERIKPIYFPNGPSSDDEEWDMIERRSKEELVMLNAKPMGVTVSDELLMERFNQIAPTPEERAKVLAEMHMTEEDSKENIVRSITGYRMKNLLTKDVTVSDEEIRNYYQNNLEAFFVPELRTVRYLRAKKDIQTIQEEIKNVAPKNFPEFLKKYNNDFEGHSGGWHELTSLNHLSTHMGPKVAKEVFTLPANQIIGPIYDTGQWVFWVNVERIDLPFQQKLEDVYGKIQKTVQMEKEAAFMQQWLEEQKGKHPYALFRENMDRSKLAAFWYDLPENLQLLFAG
ncbi:peptidyl-prolyl cis-trans isomerase [Brevibacillus dissolubilis]|uniref:peptidylprolyl isomerase n=1 Tax=Brevibacillus dissolubilis TaxID=1844116 RepID=UPI0011164D5C|nr:peptidylprolyl isomerase [Brevibacillus dissolubilis]